MSRRDWLAVVAAACAAVSGGGDSAMAEPQGAPGAEAARAGSLAIGAPAPNLDSVTWIKGEPVNQWVKGQVYVLDFWATWCGPCVASIPHINDLQARFKDQGVNVIGVAIWARPGQRISPAEFTKARGNEMNYRVAEDVGGKTAKSFMDAMGQSGIPTCMVIDREGRLAWVGHPSNGLDAVVKKVVEGAFDLKSAQNADAEAAAERKKQAEVAEKGQALMNKWQSQLMAKDWEGVIKTADELLALDANSYGQAGLYKYFIVLTKVGDKDRAATIGRGLVEGQFATIGPALNSLAWLIVNEPAVEPEMRDLELAQLAVDKADALMGGSDVSVMDTRARLYFRRGELAPAIATQTKAIAATNDPQIRDQLTARLKEYEAASEAAKPAGEAAKTQP